MSAETKSPEQIAADRIARAVFSGVNAAPDWDDGYETAEQARHCDDDDLSHEECEAIGRNAVEAISGAGLVILTAERAAQLLEEVVAYRVALAKISTIATDGPRDASAEALWRDKGRIHALAVEQIREKEPPAHDRAGPGRAGGGGDG